MAFHHASLPGRDDNISLASALSESSASFFCSDFPQVLKIAVNCGQITLPLLLIQLHFGRRGFWWSDTPAWNVYVFCNCGSVKKKPFFPESMSNFQVSFFFFFFSTALLFCCKIPSFGNCRAISSVIHAIILLLACPQSFQTFQNAKFHERA